MFSGIVQTTGKIQEIKNKNNKVYFFIEAKNFLKDVKIGESINCDGVCLTVVKKKKNFFEVELMPETLKVTKFVDSQKGDLINLEKSLKVNGKINGHFVLGHIDGVGKVKKIIFDNDYLEFFISVPQKLMKFLAYKGSVTVNGVSLTISGIDNKKNLFKISLISHTLEVTNLSELKIGDKVNIEVDVLARYLDQLKQFQ